MKSESAVLKRLGPVPFWRGERKCMDALADIYARAMDSAKDRLMDKKGMPASSAAKIPFSIDSRR